MPLFVIGNPILVSSRGALAVAGAILPEQTAIHHPQFPEANHRHSIPNKCLSSTSIHHTHSVPLCARERAIPFEAGACVRVSTCVFAKTPPNNTSAEHICRTSVRIIITGVRQQPTEHPDHPPPTEAAEAANRAATLRRTQLID